MDIPSLTDEQWDELTERLAYYASCKMARLSWRGLRAKKGANALGFDPADLAADAITSVISGDRESWNQQAYPDFYRFLQSIVDSKISALVCSSENRQTRPQQQYARPNDPSSGPFEAQAPGQTPDVACEDVEWKEKFRAALEKELLDDSIARGLFECLDAGITDRGQIAEMLGVSTNDIYNAQKRLKARTQSVMKKFEQGKKA